MYHHPASRRGGRTGHRAASRSPAPPSSAAAKAAAAAKALHRRAQERAQEKQHQLRQHQLEDELGCCNRIRNHPDPRNDVFRRNPHANSGGSILKRLTAGNNQRFHIGSSTKRDEEDNWREKSDELESSAAPKYLHHTSSHGHVGYPYPPSGISAYPIPSGSYGHPQPHIFMHHYGHSYPSSAVAADDKKGNANMVNHNSDALTTTADRHDDEEQHAKSNLHSLNTSTKALHYSAPRPYFEGGFLDPTLAHNYPYGAHLTHYPPGHHPPLTENRSVLSRDCNENGEKMQQVRPRASTTVRAATKLQTSSFTKPTTVKLESKSVTLQEVDESPPPPPRSTRCIIGSHTPIHVPRAAMRQMEEEPLPYRHPLEKNVGVNPGSVFRSHEKSIRIHRNETHTNEDEVDLLCESSAHKILLSLSKSFDRFEEVKHLSKGVPSASGVKVKEERPNSPDGPPRIQHWHKQSSDTFEPQPSPLKLSYFKDADGSNIDLTSSFTLFNESFDMNLEGLLGPNSSFGLGPMRSLSFGLGLGTSVDQGDNLRTSPMVIQRQNSKMSPKVVGNESGVEERDGGPLPNSPDSKLTLANLQVLRASPSSSFGNFIRSNNYGVDDCGDVVGKSPIMVLVGARQVASPLAEDHGHTSQAREFQNYVVIDGSTQPLSRSSRANGGSFLRNESDPSKSEVEGPECDFINKETHDQIHPQKMKRNLFGAMERHSAVFNMFSFLLPGAVTILEEDGSRNGAKCGKSAKRRYKQLTVREKEVARRRVNSALCAFGGVVIPPTVSSVWPEPNKWRRVQKYRESIPERYYEDENRLSWEIEEDPPIEVSDSDEDDADLDTVVKGKAIDDEESSQCKLCGANKSKRNHDCPLKTSLQRNIGVMVYPAVNAYTATEPGIITPALSEMNNFVDKNKLLPESTPAKTQNEFSIGTNSFLPMVSPDSIRPGTHTPSSSSILMDRKSPQQSVNYAGGAWISNHQSPRKVSPGKNSESQSTDLLFVDRQELRPEQYRIVAQKKRKQPSARYLYPALPLPYGQRKRISNAMFAMSKSIPGLTDECASVLGEARKKDAWDFAVAQLMTQVIVVTHCSVEDSMLDGLSKYLLTLGIAC